MKTSKNTTHLKPSDTSEGATLSNPESFFPETAASAAACGDARESARTAGGGRQDEPEGAPPTNRAPSNYRPDGFKVVRYGVDSLYLSYPGVLAEDWEHKLITLKELAQSDEESQQALAQVVIGDHLFEVKDRGRGRFAYVLVDNCFHIQASKGSSKTLPMAYVQISSEYLSAVGVQQAEASLRFIVNTLGLVNEDAQVSRVDLFVDYCTDLAMDIFDPLRDWITRSQSIDLHYRYNQFSGLSIGVGGDISARLYDKTLEIDKKSHKFYLHDLWRAEGWDGERKVWRLEFQPRRDVLTTLGVKKVEDLLRLQTGLWGYCTQDWLRLAIPSETDNNQTRWQTHPLWQALTEAFNPNNPQPKLQRFNPGRIPEDERLFVHGLGGVTSFMAREGIADLDEGIGEFLHQAQDYHDKRNPVVGTGKGHGLRMYINKKVKAKNRRYNTVNNRKNNLADKLDAQQRAKAYQAAKDGDDGQP